MLWGGRRSLLGGVRVIPEVGCWLIPSSPPLPWTHVRTTYPRAIWWTVEDSHHGENQSSTNGSREAKTTPRRRVQDWVHYQHLGRGKGQQARKQRPVRAVEEFSAAFFNFCSHFPDLKKKLFRFFNVKIHVGFHYLNWLGNIDRILIMFFSLPSFFIFPCPHFYAFPPQFFSHFVIFFSFFFAFFLIFFCVSLLPFPPCVRPIIPQGGRYPSTTSFFTCRRQGRTNALYWYFFTAIHACSVLKSL